ncbi:MAG: transporter substrate-binding protein [Rubritepida sp.]|nr:transporter substrate-binding protein [Rubritepida sp.]
MIPRRTLLGAGLALPAIAHAQSAATVTVGYCNPVVFREPMERIAALFESQTGTKVTLRAPEEDYEAQLQRTLRDAVTNSLPDLTLQGLNRQRTLLERDLLVDLKPLLDADAQTPTLGYSPTLLTMGQAPAPSGRVVQGGVGFAISTPILYWNAELVRRAGGDPANLPRDWDGVIALGRRIDALSEETRSLFFNWTITGNWAIQSLIFAQGGTMMDAGETRVTLADAPALAGLSVLRRLVDEAGMSDLRLAAAETEFMAGRMGMVMNSTARIGAYTRGIGERFPLVCSPFPISAAEGRVPAGGAVAVLHARDAARQALAWKFLKLATGPDGANLMVRHTGYMPATTIPAEREDLLAPFYRASPNHKVSIDQQSVMTGWYAFPGQNALRITDLVNDHAQAIVARRATPQDAATAMTREITALLPRRRA